MNDTVQGLVLKSADYKDYDALVTVLTKEYGKLTFHAAGLRKMTSRNAGSLLPYTKTEIQFDYRPHKTIFRLKTARVLQLNRYLHEDLQAGAAAGVIGEIADAFTYPGDTDVSSPFFDLTETAFIMINDKKNADAVLSLYIADTMKLTGIEPNVDACVRDGNILVSAISVKEGGFLCEHCAKEEGEKIRPAAELHLFRLIVKAGLKHYDSVIKYSDSIQWCLKLLENMLEVQGNTKIRSFTLYNRISEID